MNMLYLNAGLQPHVQQHMQIMYPVSCLLASSGHKQQECGL
jgi:hypothetical protein